ncbi:putative mitochondrial protein AtMg00310 [Silene latifolia]|uniref:putative mitochondrial protein AtMg00310 n=1 Tax=Silene latifolia TaxID=37657 RepID=UPI003D77AA13
MGVLQVTHLLFADDSIFFVKASKEEASCVKRVLRDYEGASGQVVNFDKTTVSFSKGTREADKCAVADCLGVRTVEEQERYLGLPTVVGHSKRVVASVIRDKLTKKLQGWKGHLFSKAGREVLIKAVAQSIPTYAMSVFKLPDNFCEELRSIVSRFWWGASNGKGKIPWIAWSKLCRPKCAGGLGFRDFHKFNLALLGKQAWRFLTDKSSLMVRVLGGKYFANGSFMAATLGTAPSFTWRGILEAREVLKLGARKRIGDGLSTLVWLDPWIPAHDKESHFTAEPS